MRFHQSNTMKLPKVGDYIIEAYEEEVDEVRGSNTQRMCLYVLAAIYKLIRRGIAEVCDEIVRSRGPEDGVDPVSEGVMRSIMYSQGDMMIPKNPPLSIRARGTILRSGAKYMSDLTPEVLMKQYNCGKRTVREIMEWKESYER